MAESRFQAKVVIWLRQKGCYVIVTDGRPVGVPDVIALFNGGGWAALEIKKSAKSKFQPLQKITITKLDGMYYSKAVYPENWDEVKTELVKII
jgi:hypothetical protein